jgi:lysophospholipase L1-like esterase
VVGDSLTWQAEHGSTSTTDPYYERHYLTDLLNKHGMATRVAAKSGVTTDSLRLWTRWETAPDVIVMALGTNDNYFDVPITTSINNVRTYLARWPDGCTVYVGVVPSTPRRIDDTAPAWNDWLRQEAGRTGGVYLDWPAISAGHRDWFVSDLLHHTAAGQAAYRQAILDGVEECL